MLIGCRSQPIKLEGPACSWVRNCKEILYQSTPSQHVHARHAAAIACGRPTPSAPAIIKTVSCAQQITSLRAQQDRCADGVSRARAALAGPAAMSEPSRGADPCTAEISCGEHSIRPLSTCTGV